MSNWNFGCLYGYNIQEFPQTKTYSYFQEIHIFPWLERIQLCRKIGEGKILEWHQVRIGLIACRFVNKSTFTETLGFYSHRRHRSEPALGPHQTQRDAILVTD